MGKNVWNNDHCRKYDTSEGFGDADSWVNAFFKRHTQKAKTPAPSSNLLSSCKSLKDLKVAFNMLIKTIHPDLAGESKENVAKSQALIEEFQRLKKMLK
jgi:hypothetical protein